MKNIRYKLLIVFCGVAIFTSCEYQYIADADYPEQLIYMPAAVRGIFVINDVPQPTLAVPTPGEPYKFTVDLTNRIFNIPLSVYRSGINNKGGFTVNIAANAEIVGSLISVGTLSSATQILTSDKYSLVSSIEMRDGEELAMFNLSINLDSLRNNYPDKIFALGISISSTQRASNPKFNTAIVVIDTKMMKPTAAFTQVADPTNTKKINFTNTSVYGVNYIWNFGDGSEPVTGNIRLKPSHTYVAAGSYTVTLTAIGPTGDIDKSTTTTNINVF